MENKLFMMSRRFNKTLPEDFGLRPSETPGVFILPTDNSQWKGRPLYDFGWGKEIGYYCLPLPTKLDDLAGIVLSSHDEENYGAAAVILDDFGDELLGYCLQIIEKQKTEEYSEFFRILQLEEPINRSSILGKGLSQISDDYSKWQKISQEVKQTAQK